MVEEVNNNKLDFLKLDQIHDKYITKQQEGKSSNIYPGLENELYERKYDNWMENNEKDPRMPGLVTYLKLFAPTLEFKRVLDPNGSAFGEAFKNSITLPHKNERNSSVKEWLDNLTHKQLKAVSNEFLH